MAGATLDPEDWPRVYARSSITAFRETNPALTQSKTVKAATMASLPRRGNPSALGATASGSGRAVSLDMTAQ